MKIIKIATYLSEFFEELTNRARVRALAKVEHEEEKARNANMEARIALSKVWDAEVGRHNEALRKLREEGKEHENRVNLKFEELNAKAKEIRLA